jgi:hypothetical protein
MAGAGIAGARVGAQSSPNITVYVPTAPQRVLDTRSGLGAPVGKVTTRTFSFATVPAVPVDARAVAINVTATEGTEESYLAVQPAGAGDGGISNVNFRAGQTAANLVTVPLGDGGAVQIVNGAGEVHVIVDLIGYYVDAPSNTTPGPAGPAGPPGPSGSANYGYVYNQGAQVVPLEADVSFDHSGVLLGGVTHAGGSTITITDPGTYLVSFSVSGVEPNQFSLVVNGAPVSEATYGSGAGTQQTTGQAILVFAAGDVLTLRNHTSAAAVTLQTLAGGTQINVNASVLVQQLS